jgi:hypothetical protein
MANVRRPQISFKSKIEQRSLLIAVNLASSGLPFNLPSEFTMVVSPCQLRQSQHIFLQPRSATIAGPIQSFKAVVNNKWTGE